MKTQSIPIYVMISEQLRKIGVLILTAVLLAIHLKPIHALASDYTQTTKAPSLGVTLVRGSSFTDPKDLETFSDTYFKNNMDKYHIPGAVFVVVKDGQIILQKGYGYTNLVNKTVADPNNSLFRIASVTKIFAAIAIMQLAEKGLVNLQDDVNIYLTKIKVSNPFPTPLTIGDLLTHTDGFEERNTKIFALESDELAPLEELLADELKPLTNQPGSMITYGSFSTALASYIVQEISGMPFEQYVRENIFVPLNMNDSTLEQTLSKDMMQRVAITYLFGDKGFEPTPYLMMSTPATGGASVTGTSMGKLLISLLHKGELNGNRILNEHSVLEMFTRQFGVHDDVPGVTYGFFEHFENGRRCLIREGSGLGVNSRVFLLPEENVAFFVAYNTRGSEMNIELTSEFLDRYYPTQAPLPSMSDQLTSDAKECAGLYGYVQSSQYTLTKISKLFAGLLLVKPNSDGSLTITPLGMGDPFGGFEQESRWIETKSMLFELEDGNGTIYFGESEDGSQRYLFSGQGYHGSYQRMRWYQTPTVHIAIVLFFVLTFITAIIIGFKQHKTDNPLSNAHRWERAMQIFIGIVNLVFLAASMPVMFMAGSVAGFPSIAFVGSLHPLVVFVMLLPIVSISVTSALSVLTLRGLNQGVYKKNQKAIRLCYLACCLLFLGYLGYWNLIGFCL